MKKLAIEGGPKSITKMFDLGATYFEEEITAVTKVIKSQTISGFVANDGPKFLGGQKVKDLESLFNHYFNSKYAVASNSATSSLHSALVAIGIKAGDEVIVPAVSMSATASSILMAGGTPIFIDINNGVCTNCDCNIKDADSQVCFNINTNLIEKKITKNTKAMMIVHLFGKSTDMAPIINLSKKYNLKIIEDCAQSPGTKYNGKLVGTLGDIGVFSFNQSKTMSAGEGGVAITNNKKYALRMQLMRNHAEAMIESFPDAENEKLIGYNYRMTELEAAVAYEQFKKLDEFNENKIRLANLLTKLLKPLAGLQTINNIVDNENVIFIYPLIYRSNYFTLDRKDFVKACLEEGVPMVNGYTKPIVDLPLFKKFNTKNSFLNSKEMHYNKLISLKICHHYNVSNNDIIDVGNAIIKVHKFFENNYKK